MGSIATKDPIIRPIGTYGITGIKPPNGVKSETAKIPFAPDMPLRREISTLYAPAGTPKNPKPIWDDLLKKQWTLYVYALEEFKALPVEDKLSYFQVAGIHGYPETPWDLAGPPNQDPPEGEKPKPGQNPFGGYCEHNTLAFPTWHRPYMLLFEQRLYEEMDEVIRKWKQDGHLTEEDEKKWRYAADNWRLPYWDWARQQKYNSKFAVPEVLTKAKVKVHPPFSKDITEVWNPLWEFENPMKDVSGQPLMFGDVDMGEWRIKPDFVDPTISDKTKRYALPNRIRWDLTPRTGRYGVFLNQRGNKYIGHDGVNNFASANATMTDLRMNMVGDGKKPVPGTLADAVSRLFSREYNAEWGTFASTKWKKEHSEILERKPTAALSLESIHNQVHNVSGGVDYATGMGHMSDVPVAAFDPIFWLHHCNIDRITAIWQVLHWDNWWDTLEPPGNNVVDKQPTDPLQPFHTRNNGNPDVDVYNSNDVRDWTKLHYQYDDLEAHPSVIEDGKLLEDQYIFMTQAKMESLYPSTGQFVWETLQTRKETPSQPGDSQPVPGGINEDDGKWNDYVINVIYDRYALGGRSYTINFYLGGDQKDSAANMSAINLIGRVYTFSAGTSYEGSVGCANCTDQRKAGVLSKAQIPLTIALLRDALDVEISDLNTIERDDVVEYLKKNLHFKYVAYGGSEVPADRFKKTVISVVRGTGVHDEIKFHNPMWSEAPDTGPKFKKTHVPLYDFNDFEYLYEVTKDMEGGDKGN